VQSVLPLPTSPPFASVVTEDLDEGGDNFVRQTQCTVAPPSVELIQASTFQYRYEVVADENATPLSKNFATRMTNQIHDAIAAGFFTCDFSEASLWILQSAMHEADTSEACQSSDSDNCVIMTANGRVLTYEAPSATNGGRRRERHLQTEIADSFADEVIAFLEESMTSNDFALDGFIESTSFSGGTIIVTASPLPGTSVAPVAIPVQSPVASPVESTTVPISDSETSSSNLQQNSDSGGLAAPYIASIVVGGCLLLLLGLMAFSRGKSATDSSDASSSRGEYLRRADDNAELEVDHLDLDSQARSSRTIPEPIIVITTFGSSSEEEDLDPFTSSSASRRSRRGRGPLGSQDELDRSVTAIDDGMSSKFRDDQTSRSYALRDTVVL
jgi:hypothetical protein